MACGGEGDLKEKLRKLKGRVSSTRRELASTRRELGGGGGGGGGKEIDYITLHHRLDTAYKLFNHKNIRSSSL